MRIDRFWEEHSSHYKYRADAMTMRDVLYLYQLDPPPPKPENINDYILPAKEDKKYFLFFLHHYERRLNGRISRFLIREGLDRYDPVRFLDYKQNCIYAMLECLTNYDPGKGADFLTYAHHFIGNSMLICRMREEAGSFESLYEYKVSRGIAWLYNNSQKSEKEVIAEYATKTGLSEEAVTEHLTAARRNRNRVPFYVSLGEDGEETGEDIACGDSWNNADTLWNGIRATAVRKAFEKLGYRDQILLERRNAICMTCNRVSPMKTKLSFEDLAIMFEGTGADGAEIAYRRAVERLTVLLVEDGILHVIRLKRKSMTKRKKKIAAAIYQYQADCDGEWGELHLNFENRTAEIVKLADWDTTLSHIFANRAIHYLLNCENGKLPKETMVAFEG